MRSRLPSQHNYSTIYSVSQPHSTLIFTIIYFGYNVLYIIYNCINIVIVCSSLNQDELLIHLSTSKQCQSWTNIILGVWPLSGLVKGQLTLSSASRDSRDPRPHALLVIIYSSNFANYGIFMTFCCANLNILLTGSQEHSNLGQFKTKIGARYNYVLRMNWAWVSNTTWVLPRGGTRIPLRKKNSLELP